jgi:CDP-glycerol glycerophosphotransferase (TagB/SpsB family)
MVFDGGVLSMAESGSTSLGTSPYQVFKVEDGGAVGIADDAYLSSVGLNLYEFLSSSSALITDYSSVYYDYLLTERPIGLNFEDAEEYGAEWGLWYDDVRASLPGHLIDNCDEMVDFIRKVASRDDEYLEKRRALVKSYGIECKPSSELIVNFIKDKLKSNGVIK